MKELHLDEVQEWQAIFNAEHSSPHKFLGMIKNGKDLILRAFLKNAVACSAIDLSTNKAHKLRKIEGISSGAFQITLKNRKAFPYKFKITTEQGEKKEIHDPYNYSQSLTDEDLYLFGEGNHHKIYNKFGAHLKSIDGVSGTSFAVWAPNARRVSVVGDFNGWDGRYLPMQRLGNSGVWELFVPGISQGEKYKYEMLDANNHIRLKSDPYGFFFEGPPHNSSIVAELEDYQWKDSNWLKNRSKKNFKEEPMSVYEVHLDSWRRVVEEDNRPLNYVELASELVAYVKKMGFTHVEFLPLAEHPFLGSWGYQVTGFFAPTHRYGSPKDFMLLVDTLHQNNIGVIIDWVPGHFPKDDFALASFDGTCLYEHQDSRKGEHKDWGTLVFNYGRNEVRNFLICSALYWFDKFHIDGVRVDAVASMLYLDYSREAGEWLPNQYGGRENVEAIEFLRQINDLIHQYYPGAISIAEESTSFGLVTHPSKDHGLGFDFKWNMGWMHDTLSYLSKDPVYRKHHHNQLTFAMLYQNSENFVSALSHDEVVHGKSSLINKMGSWSSDDKIATLKAMYAYMWAWPGKKTLFMGGEFAQSDEWKYYQSLDWHLLQYESHKGVQNLIKDLNKLYLSKKFLAKYDHHEQGFQWVNPDDSDNSVISFLRRGDKDEIMLVVCNFTPVMHENYRVGAPHKGVWQEVLNTNAQCYNGNGQGNYGQSKTENIPYNNFEQSLHISLPPLSTLVFYYKND